MGKWVPVASFPQFPISHFPELFMRLGIFGGTFDPIHIAHLFVAEEARVRCALDKVLFVPNAVPPHKAREVSAPERRLEMTRLATASNPAFEVSPIELERPGRSYTVDTLAALKAQHPQAELFFIIGTDALAEIQTWRKPEEVARRCMFIVPERPGCTLDDLRRMLAPVFMERVLPLPTLHLAVSSTDIRLRVREGHPIRYLTADAVADYIAENRLYKCVG
jgi:nicotinate-nucleotide adenylyltransferase